MAAYTFLPRDPGRAVEARVALVGLDVVGKGRWERSQVTFAHSQDASLPGFVVWVFGNEHPGPGCADKGYAAATPVKRIAIGHFVEVAHYDYRHTQLFRKLGERRKQTTGILVAV